MIAIIILKSLNGCFVLLFWNFNGYFKSKTETKNLYIQNEMKTENKRDKYGKYFHVIKKTNNKKVKRIPNISW